MVKTTVKIDGMRCGMCEAHMNDTVRQKFTVKSVKSSFKNAESVIISEEPIDEEALKAAIAEIGYEYKSMTSCEAKKGLFGWK